MSDVLQWTPTRGRAKTRRLARTYIQQLSGDTGGSPEDQPKAMDDREVWRERIKNIRADDGLSEIKLFWYYLCIAQSAGTVEYTDSAFAEG